MRATFSTLQSAVEHVARALQVRQNTQFGQFVQDELAQETPDLPSQSPDKRRLAALYDLRARHLDWELGTGYLGFFAHNAGTRYTFTRRMEGVLQLLPALSAESQVLEIGCGAGLLCLWLAQQAHRVVGTDISFFVLDFARQVQQYLQQRNVLFQMSDAECLPFGDNTFDVVMCSEVLEHLLHPETALREMRRVVKPTGTVVLSTPCAVSLSDLAMDLFRVFHPHIEAEKDVHFDKKTYLATRRQGEQVTEETFVRVHLRFRYADLSEMVHQAGFVVERALGTVFAFPPHYQVFYRYCPTFCLPAIRGVERLLNAMNLFQRFGSVTTCFRLKPA